MTELLWGARYFRHLVTVGRGSTSSVHEASKLLVDLTRAAVVFVELQGERTFQRGLLRDAEGRDRYIANRSELPLAAANHVHDTLNARSISADDRTLVRSIEADAPIVGVVLLVKPRDPKPSIEEIDRELVALFAEALAMSAMELTSGRIGLTQQLERFARRLIREELARNDDNVSAAARELSVTRKYVQRRLPKRAKRPADTNQ